jgi:hypothetical protein
MIPRALRAPIAHPHPPLHLRHHVNNTRCRRLVDPLFPVVRHPLSLSPSHKPDSDREDSVWDDPEAYSAVVTRKEHPRNPTALLSLLEMMRHKVPVDCPLRAVIVDQFLARLTMRHRPLRGSSP